MLEFVDNVLQGALQDNELEILILHVADVVVGVESLHRDLRTEFWCLTPELVLQLHDKPGSGVLLRVEYDALLTESLMTSDVFKPRLAAQL